MTRSATATPLDDDAIRHRITRGALDQTLFVEAGAGSGKTTLLVDRIVNLVLDTDARLASIAAITFTEAAATELQSRIRAKFEVEEATARKAGNQARADRCRGAVADTDLAAITTLHGFANRILGEFAVAAGLPPQVRVLDEVSSQLAHEDRWLRFVDRLYDSDEHLEVLLRASALQIPLEARYTGQTTMRDVAVEFNQNWDRLGRVIGAELGPVPEIDFGPFDHAVDELARRAEECTDPEDLLYIRVHELLPAMRAIEGLDDPRRKLRALHHMGEWTPGRGGRTQPWGSAEGRDEVKALIRAVNTAGKAVLAPIVDDVLLRLSQLIAVEVVDAAKARCADGGLEFHDLLVLARNLLRTHGAARAALHDRFGHLLLDEFQDTDPIQIELAVLIATCVADVGDRPWHELDVEPGRLFFVGDPKQSIYRFRRADIALFLAARDRFAGPDGAAQLSTNFRSAEPILDFVNAMFEQVMSEEIAGSQPRYQPLVAQRTVPGADAERRRPVLLGGPHEDPKVSAADLRTAEADDVVGLIRAIVADPAAWPIQDPGARKPRPARLEDITILVPSRTSLPFLRAALDGANLRYQIATGTLVYDTQEVADALATLRAIDDPTDELSLVAALRSPLYGCSDIDLVTWRNAGGRWDVRAAAPASIKPSHMVAAAIEHLRGLWRERWFLTPSALLERLLRERRAALLAFGDPRTIDVWRRLRFLVEQARAFEETGTGGLRGFTDWAALQAGSRTKVHEPLLPETDEAGVSIQTIHGAKGLEFPITIVSGMTTQRQGQRQGVSVLWGDDGTPSIRMRSGIASTSHEPLADVEAEMDDYERDRLVYVAVTRARDHLVVSCHHKQSSAAKTYGGQFWQLFDHDDRRGLWRRFDWREVVGAAPPERPRAAQLGLALDDRDRWVRDREALLGPYRRPRVISATGVAQAAIAQTQPGRHAPPAPTGSAVDAYLTEGRSAPLIDRTVSGDAYAVDRSYEALIDRQAEASEDGIDAPDDGYQTLIDRLADQGDNYGADQPDDAHEPLIDPLVDHTGMPGAHQPDVANATDQTGEQPIDGLADVAGTPSIVQSDAYLTKPPTRDPYESLIERLVDEDDDRADQPDDASPAGSSGRAGSAVGSAVHAVLQRIDLGQPRDLADIVAQQCQLAAVPDRAELVRQLVEGALAAPVIEEARHHRHYKELFVTAPIEGMAIEGYVDLVIDTPDGLIVVDYKTDAISHGADVDAKVARYELQAAAYALALEAVTKRPVLNCYFVFCTTRGAIERTVADLAGARQRARDTIAAFASY